jgi:hypothetical protein
MIDTAARQVRFCGLVTAAQGRAGERVSGHRWAGGEEYELRLLAQADDDAPPVCRLRRALRALLRAYGFRVISVRDVTPPLTPMSPAVAAVEGDVTQDEVEVVQINVRHPGAPVPPGLSSV